MYQIYALFFLTTSISILPACSNTNLSDAKKTSKVIDSLVSGLSYETPTYSGETDASSHFIYLGGEDVNFHISDIILGTAISAAMITPINMVSAE